MKSLFISPLIICFLFSDFCQAQDCKFITKIKTSTFATYVGIIDIPPDYNNTTSNKFLTVDLAKYVKADTSFIFALSIEAIVASTNSTSTTVTFQFEGNSALVKSDQLLHTTPMTRGRALLSVNVRLALNEILLLKNSTLTSVIVADSKVIVPNPVSIALRKVAGCLPTFQ